MASFGITPDLIPVSSTGKVKFGAHISWLKVQRIKLQTKNDSDIVECPRLVDVVFKHGPAYKNNPGNMYFRELIEISLGDHLDGTKDEKCKITMRILKQIEARKGRILEWSKRESTWRVVRNRNVMRKKIAATFKQQHRQRKTTTQMKKTIENALYIAADNETSREQANPKRYYDSDQLYHERKRVRTGCFDCDGDAEDPDFSCFGRSFHPTWGGND
ncbi:unnamed protein product [Pseudo-nitzschia multistriata]|uniref:DUF6824 domain-containing protein n=1 Tax=Pseudo-nitzschia multistriata TaxID=183589 RepID=A0A448Z5V8_9STRA|nr:unnamed protein product [Pseudo-nitzschia multistriata]